MAVHLSTTEFYVGMAGMSKARLLIECKLSLSFIVTFKEYFKEEYIEKLDVLIFLQQGQNRIYADYS